MKRVFFPFIFLHFNIAEYLLQYRILCKNFIIENFPILPYRNTKSLQKKFEIFISEKMFPCLMKHWSNTVICCLTYLWFSVLINRLKLMPKIPKEKAIIIGTLNSFYIFFNFFLFLLLYLSLPKRNSIPSTFLSNNILMLDGGGGIYKITHVHRT